MHREGDPAESSSPKTAKTALRTGAFSGPPIRRRPSPRAIEPGERKEVYLVQSSPPGGGRAQLRSRPYDLPGDKFNAYELNLFDIDSKKATRPKIDRVDFGVSKQLRWQKDGRHFTYEKIDRGHDPIRLIEVNAQ